MPNLVRALAATLLATGFAAFAQDQSSIGGETLHAQAIRLYGGAKPYIDLPVDKLQRQIHELHGLKIDEDQGKLDGILQRATDAVLLQLPRIPNLVAREEVAFETEQSQMVRGSVGVGRRGGPVYAVGDRELVVTHESSYEFLIRRERREGGSPVLRESRRDPRTSNEETNQQMPQALGFSQLWMLFTPAEIYGQRYRYMGTQKVNGRMTDAVVFAQIPEQVPLPGVIQLASGPVAMLQQGVVWLDQQTSQIVRIRTDLLAPVPQIQADSITSTTEFSAVRLVGFDEILWLPKRIDLTWMMQGQNAGEIHRYSKYRLYKAKIRILIPKDEDLVIK